MAQAVFDEHPLEQYLRQAGDDPEPMPGTTAELTQELDPFSLSSLSDTNDPDTDTDTPNYQLEEECRPQFLIYLSQFIETILANAQLTTPANPFVERFKYNVISSTLLSPNLPNLHTHSHLRNSSACPQIPGKFSHSRTPSELNQAPQSIALLAPHLSDVVAGEVHYGLLSALTVVFSVLYGVGLTTLAMLSLWIGLAAIYYLNVQSQNARHPDLTPSLQTLDDLISTNARWESIVQEVMTTLEKDERTVLGSSSSYTSPSSPLRAALHSTLQTTETQCDNVRHLLSALTSPSELSQLAEMYAPPSPHKSYFSQIESVPRVSKSFSYPHHARRSEGAVSVPSYSPTRVMLTDHKRMTWNGPSSTSMTPMKKVLKRRSDLSSVRRSSASGPTVSYSAPVTPLLSSPLKKVSEISIAGSLCFDDPFVESQDEIGVDDGASSSFAAAALKLQQNRVHDGLESFANDNHSPPPSPPLSTSYRLPSHMKPISNEPGYMPTLSPRSARLTSIHASRQPLSLSALRQSLQAAIAAKRYACAHLLALRFTGDDAGTASLCQTFAHAAGHGMGEVDAGYWDDVKSIMELLIGALSDTSARLCEALRVVDAMRLRDQTPTPVGSVDLRPSSTSPGSELTEVRKLIAEKEGKRTRLSEIMMVGYDMTGTIGGVVSFAPIPSPLSRFAGHVATIQTALEDSRRHLEDCVSNLKSSDQHSSLFSSAQPQGASNIGSGGSDHHHPALLAYEKLRRELGFALRECERGRNRLLDIVKPPQPAGMEFEEEQGESPDGVPGLAHDSQSDESEKHDMSPLYSEDGAKDVVEVVNPDEGGDFNVRFVDDASRELLLGVDVAHLPPAHLGPEQVFEADTSVSSDISPIRPKSKLSREERIKLVKARRESGRDIGRMGVDLKPSPSIHGDEDNDRDEREEGYDEKWGPGGDVVQELKDVIWKVGERRRKVQGGESTRRIQTPLKLTDQLAVSEQQPVTEDQPKTEMQAVQEREQPPISDEQGNAKSVVHELNAAVSLPEMSISTPSKLPSLVSTPRPRRPTSTRISSPLAKNSTESSNGAPQLKSRSRRVSLIPRRSASVMVAPTDPPSSILPQRTSMMNMTSLLESLQKEVGARGSRDGEEVLSAE